MDAIVELFHQNSRRLATLTCIVIVVLMSASVARTTWFFVEHMSQTTMTPTTQVQPQQGRTSTSKSVDLAALNLFGRVQDQASQVVDAPETRLNLELQGVFTADGRENSTAIVAEGNKPGKLYHIGDRLPGNATLTDVFDNYILIRRDNKIEKLMFEDSAFRNQTAGTISGTDARARREPGGSVEQVRNRIANRSRSERSEEGSTPAPPGDSFRDHLEHYRQRLDDNPDEVMNELGIRSVEKGDSKGYEVGGDVSNVALQRAGLQQGDVILSVNGQPVGDVANDRALIDQAVDAGRVRVEVQRGSRRFYLTVPIPEQ